jgi:hypothetical protein
MLMWQEVLSSVNTMAGRIISSDYVTQALRISLLIVCPVVIRLMCQHTQVLCHVVIMHWLDLCH